MADRKYRVNHAIRTPKVRLISKDGEQVGIVDVRNAQRMATDAGLDLVEISPATKPPVCKILDFGKYRFEQEKKNKILKKRNKTTKLKEIRMQPKIEEHDLQFKTRHIREFLSEGNKVKVTIRFRGRELAHTELGENVLKKIATMLGDTFHTDKAISMEGRFMSMIISPRLKNKQGEGVKYAKTEDK